MGETKKVEVPFVLVDKFSAAAGAMKHAAERTAGAVEKMSDKFGEFRREQNLTTAALFGVGFGLGAITEKVKETVGEFGRVQKSLASFYAGNLMWSKSVGDVERYDRGLALAKGTTKELHELSGRFGGTLEDMAGIYRKVGAAAGPLHLSQEKTMQMTTMAAAAQKRWGISGEQAASTLARVLQKGTVRGFDEMSIALRGALGNMKKVGEGKIFEKLQHAMASNVTIADKMSTGIGDSLRRIQSATTGVFEEIAGPVFDKLAKSFSGFATKLTNWADHNGPQIEKFGNDLVRDFEVLERVSALIFKHWKEIAAVWVGMKAGGLVKQMAGAFGGGEGGGGGMKAAAGKFGNAVALPLVGGAVASIMEYRSRQNEIEENVKSVKGLYGDLAKLRMGPGGVLTTNDAGGVQGVLKSVAKELRGVGIKETGDYDARMRELYASAKIAGGGVIGASSEKLDEMTGLLRTLVEKKNVLSEAGEATGPESQLDKDKKLKLNGPPVMNFNGGIKVEQKFDDADADRVFLRFKDDLEQYGRRPTQAAGALPEGL